MSVKDAAATSKNIPIIVAIFFLGGARMQQIAQNVN